MKDPDAISEDPMANASREEILSALFANMVVQQTNMALMFLGRTPHPETGQTIFDLEAARMFIDQLEMLEAKTKGNLSRQEDALIRQALSSLQMAFVEAVDAQPGGKGGAGNERRAPEPAPRAEEPKPSAPPPAAGPSAAPPPATDESRKKFSKKY